MKKLIVYLTLLININTVYILAFNTACGDWLAYKEEKCLKVLDKSGLLTYDDAEQLCQQQDVSSRLVSITFQDEQDFIAKYLFDTLKIVDNVWIGAKYQGDKFVWNDGTDLIYTNWVKGSPKNQTNTCVQLISYNGLVGKWVDKNCAKRNVVFCQKLQTWSISKLQQNLLNVMKNPVPIGFTYVQLSNDLAPNAIWPWMIWSDISSQYAGVFFRVEGGQSDKFGVKQSDTSPRLYSVKNHKDMVEQWKTIYIQPGIQSSPIYTGDYTHELNNGLSFYVSGGEVRPVNMAMRIWKRTG